MKTRIITGLAAAFLLILLIYQGPVSLITAVVIGAAAMAYVEFDRLFFSQTTRIRQVRLCLLIALTIVAIPKGPLAAWVAFWLSFLVLAIWSVVAADRKNDFPASVRDFSLEVTGYVYVVGLFGFLCAILDVNARGRDFLLLLFILVFVGDTLAYFVGSRWGKHRLAPHISPKKSVEGAVASIAGAVIGAGVWILWIYRTDLLSPLGIRVLLAAPVISILAQLGDLFESMLKRSQTQKDSGSFLPGHGGMLDRIDGLLLAAPVFFMFLIFVLGELA